MSIGENLIALSRRKWNWMSAKDVESLEALVHDEAIFVHMGATFTASAAPRCRRPMP